MPLTVQGHWKLPQCSARAWQPAGDSRNNKEHRTVGLAGSTQLPEAGTVMMTLTSESESAGSNIDPQKFGSAPNSQISMRIQVWSLRAQLMPLFVKPRPRP